MHPAGDCRAPCKFLGGTGPSEVTPRAPTTRCCIGRSTALAYRVGHRIGEGTVLSTSARNGSHRFAIGPVWDGYPTVAPHVAAPPRLRSHSSIGRSGFRADPCARDLRVCPRG